MVHANLWYAAVSGFFGAIILTALMYVLKAVGQNLDLPYLLGSRFVDVQQRSRVYVTGIILHLLAGAAWGILYIILLTGLAVNANWPAGILFGFAHGIFVGVLIGNLTQNHPYVGEGKPISDPGILGSNWSNLMPYWILALHMIYGVTTLAIYHQFIQT